MMAAAARVAAASPHPPGHRPHDRDLEPSLDAAIIDGVQPSQRAGRREERVCHAAAAPALYRRRHRRLRGQKREGSNSSSPGETFDDRLRRGRSHHPQSLSAPSRTTSRPLRPPSFLGLSALLLILLSSSSSIATSAASRASSSAAFASSRIGTPTGAGRRAAASHPPPPPPRAVIEGAGTTMRGLNRCHRRGISASTTNGDGGEMTTTRARSSSSTSALLASSSPSPSGGGKDRKDGDDASEEFWESQRLLAKELSAEMDFEENARQRVQLEKFAKRRLALVSDTLFFSVLIFSALWGASDDPFTPISYLFGAILGTAYSYGLGKYVETLGGSAGNEETVMGAGVGQARFAFLIVLFILLGKFRGQTGLQELPAISGFFTYQLASLSQGLREIDD